MGKRKKKKTWRGSRALIVLAGICGVSAAATGMFIVSVPLLNSASTAGNVAGFFSAIAFAFVMETATAAAVRKYREASR